MISVSAALADTVPPNATIKGTVLQVSPIEQYTNKEGNKKTVFTAIVADASASIRVKCYNGDAYAKFSVDGGVILMNFIHKPNEIVITIKSIVAIGEPVNVPAPIRQQAVRLIGSDLKTLSEALHSPSKEVSSIKAKVMKVIVHFTIILHFNNSKLPAVSYILFNY